MNVIRCFHITANPNGINKVLIRPLNTLRKSTTHFVCCSFRKVNWIPVPVYGSWKQAHVARFCWNHDLSHRFVLFWRVVEFGAISSVQNVLFLAIALVADCLVSKHKNSTNNTILVISHELRVAISDMHSWDEQRTRRGNNLYPRMDLPTTRWINCRIFRAYIWSIQWFNHASSLNLMLRAYFVHLDFGRNDMAMVLRKSRSKIQLKKLGIPIP